MQMPQTIEDYFEADGRNDRDAVLQCFGPDAVVNDEGHSSAGQDAIGTWWDDTKAKYHHTAEPIEATTRGHGTRVKARVTGDFAGSPAMMTYAFTLSGDKIAALEFGA